MTTVTKAFLKWLDSLSEYDLDTLSNYTQNDMNTIFYGHSPLNKNMQDRAKALDDLIQRSPIYARQYPTLFRGMAPIPENPRKGYLSTTTDFDVANELADMHRESDYLNDEFGPDSSQKSGVYQIQPDRYMKAIDVDALEKHYKGPYNSKRGSIGTNESEILLPRGGLLRPSPDEPDYKWLYDLIDKYRLGGLVA